MSPLLEPLRERLLTAGLPPARVRRYLLELADHYDDLFAEEEASGKQGGVAHRAALARLGAIEELAAAMTSDSRFRAFASRAPWMVLPGAAIIGLAAGYAITTLLMIGAVEGFGLHVGHHLMPPAWLPPLADTLFRFDRYLLPILIGWGLGALALRRRLHGRWPAMAMIVVALLGAGLYCQANWPSEPSEWRFHVGSLVDDLAGERSAADYPGLALANFLVCWLPYLALRRRFRTGLAGLTIAGLLGGCAGSPPTADEILQHLAAHRKEVPESDAVPATPEDGAAMDQAAEQIRSHVATRPPPARVADSEDSFHLSVTAPHSMAGNWKMVSPTRLDVHNGAPDSYARVQSFLCRIEQKDDDLEGACLPSRKHIRGTLRGDAVVFSWQAGLISAEIRGRLLTPTDFAGTLALGTLGIGLMGTDIPAYGSKITTGAPSIKEQDDLAAMLLADLSAGAFSSDAYGAAFRQAAMNESPLPRDEISALGGVRGLSYLGAVETPTGDAAQQKVVKMAVYDVEFARGWKLCGFTRDGDGRIDGVECR